MVAGMCVCMHGGVATSMCMCVLLWYLAACMDIVCVCIYIHIHICMYRGTCVGMLRQLA